MLVRLPEATQWPWPQRLADQVRHANHGGKISTKKADPGVLEDLMGKVGGLPEKKKNKS